MPIEAVIFDMDGVLVASEDYWWESRVEWAARYGKTWTHDDQRAAMGRNTVEWAEVMRERLDLPELPLEQVMKEVTGLVLGRIEARLPTLPNAVESVHIAASAYRVALASGSPTAVIQKVLTLTGLDKVFEVKVFGDDMQRGKPHPDIYLHCARLLGVDPSDCVGIEDSSNGIRALQAANMKIIAVPSPGFPLPEDIIEMADIWMPSLEDFSVQMIASLSDEA